MGLGKHHICENCGCHDEAAAAIPCDECGGEGYLGDDVPGDIPCNKCEGSGRIECPDHQGCGYCEHIDRELDEWKLRRVFGDDA